ncbi:MAG: tetracycline resistance efflux pump [Gemmatimonadetes bacterium]|nr:tetracycline resistance efflux pump [Gemmatimonadota bacterium]
MVFATVFLDLVGFGIVIPLLPLYAQRFGAGPVAVTWLVAVYSLMQFFFAPWWGRLSDRVGRRPILLLGLFGSALSYLAFGLAPSLTVLFAARILAGVMSAHIGVAQAYVADVTPPEKRARGMGMIGAAFGLGFIFGPAIGGVLAHYGPAVPFLGASLLTAVNGVVAVFRLPESLPLHLRGTPQAESRPGLGARLGVLFGRATGGRLRALYATSFLVTAAFAAVEATLSLWTDRRWHFTPAQVAYFFAYLGIVAVLAQGLIVHRLVKRVGERTTARMGLVLLAASLVAIPLAPTHALLAVAGAMFALGQGAVIPAVSSLISRQGGPTEQGRLLGASQSLSALGRVLGPAWGGIAFARIGIGAPALSGAALAAVALAVLSAGSSAAPVPGVDA